jgi:two-component system sensor histidine kinase KdpD
VRAALKFPDRRQLIALIALAVPSLALATAAVWLLQDVMGVPNPSAVYLVAVVICAIQGGAFGATVAAVGSFLLYDFLFVDPRLTFTISDPAEYVSLVLLLFVGIVVGQLAAVQRSQTQIARTREREARSLFRLSRALATRESTPAVLGELVGILKAETAVDRVWIAIGRDHATERVAADTSDSQRPPASAFGFVLRRTPEDEPAQWVRVHERTARPRGESGALTFRVRIETAEERLGSIWASAGTGDREPLDATATRLFSAAADQIGQALVVDRLAAESHAAEIARQSDELKSALLQSVSHDLRTPLATIRAAAGSLRPRSALTDDEREQSVDAIDREVEYLNRLVTNLLDLSRIEAGAIKPDLDVFELDDLVRPSIERLGKRLGNRNLEVRLTSPPVRLDPIFLDSSITNIVDNAIKYTPENVTIRISAGQLDKATVRLTIEDSGPGVPDKSLPRLFEKFYRVPGVQRTSRSGTGVGLAVVRGLVQAMHGDVAARRSSLGGLAIDIDLPVAAPVSAAK